MKTMLTLIILSVGIQAASAQKGKCPPDQPIEWIINPTYVDGTTPNRILGDGVPYINGQSGVAAVIQVCSGTNDATLQISSPRTLSLSFYNLLYPTPQTPSWALSGSMETDTTFLNVRNLLFVPAGKDRSMEYTFTTWFGTGGTPTGFKMRGPAPQAPQGGAGGGNSPYPESLIVVHHCPAGANTSTCPNPVQETWFAYPDPNPTASGASQTTGLPITQVGTLFVSSKGQTVNAGEFSMPFLFTISLLP
ncbi:MAG TPA: hypothetical protein VKB79_09335 [Bryobacteraceae bacterium]|nr:hypothetical protein [Bryobacteraceae bacterium]